MKRFSIKWLEFFFIANAYGDSKKGKKMMATGIEPSAEGKNKARKWIEEQLVRYPRDAHEEMVQIAWKNIFKEPFGEILSAEEKDMQQCHYILPSQERCEEKATVQWQGKTYCKKHYNLLLKLSGEGTKKKKEPEPEPETELDFIEELEGENDGSPETESVNLDDEF